MATTSSSTARPKSLGERTGEAFWRVMLAIIVGAGRFALAVWTFCTPHYDDRWKSE